MEEVVLKSESYKKGRIDHLIKLEQASFDGRRNHPGMLYDDHQGASQAVVSITHVLIIVAARY